MTSGEGEHEDDFRLPDGNRVSSEWEKNEWIWEACDRARADILPHIFRLLEEQVAENVWITSPDLFRDEDPEELEFLWSQPDYCVAHRAVAVSVAAKKAPDATTNNTSLLDGTTTELFFEKLPDAPSTPGSGSSKPPKRTKHGPSHCLLRQTFSDNGWKLVLCKLRRRHQKEIARLSADGSTKPSSVSSSEILDGLVRLVLRKLDSSHAVEQSPKDDESESAIQHDDSHPASDPDPPYTHQAWRSVLQSELQPVVSRALARIRASKNLEILPGTLAARRTTVRWKDRDDFEIRYYVP